MARVACTHYAGKTVRDRVGRWSTVLSGGANPFTFWRIREKVDICRSRNYICRVVENLQLGLIDSNRRSFSEKKIRSTKLHRS